jgi:prevent-host-death family protein
MADDNTAHKDDTKLTEATADDVRRAFGDFLSRAGFGNERIVIVRHGKQIAALVGIADFDRIRSLDNVDATAA